MLAIMIPTYNEKDNLPVAVSRIMDVCSSLDARVVIVDDNSPDGTGKVAETLKNRYRNKIIVIHRKEKGRGTAGIRGFQEALKLKPAYIMEMDADLSHDPKYIKVFMKEIQKYDIVSGSRFVRGGKAVGRSFLRNTISSVGNLVSAAVLGVDVKDMQSGYKCYRTEVLESLDFSNFVSKGYSIGMETLYRAHKKGFTIGEIPITFVNRKKGKSKFSLNEMLWYFINLFRVKFSGI